MRLISIYDYLLYKGHLARCLSGAPDRFSHRTGDFHVLDDCTTDGRCRRAIFFAQADDDGLASNNMVHIPLLVVNKVTTMREAM